MKSTIENWAKWIEQAAHYRKHFGGSEEWQTYRDYYRGLFPGMGTVKGEVLPYNITYAQLEVLVPNVCLRNPYIFVSPRKQSMGDLGNQVHAKIVESLDNWLIQELKIKQQMRTAVRHAYFCGRGIFKVGYDAPTSGEEERVYSELGLEGVEELAERRKALGVQPGMPWVICIDPDHFLVSFGARTLDDAEWADHIIIRQLEDVKADKLYKNTSKLEGTHMESSLMNPNKVQFYEELSKHIDWVEIHEIRHARSEQLIGFVQGHDKFVRGPQDDELQIEGLPFVDFVFNEDTEYYWATPDVRIFEPQQLEMNDARTQAMHLRRRALLRLIGRKNALSKGERAKLLSNEPVVYLEAEAGANIQNDFMALQLHIPQDLPLWTNQIRSDVREIMGFGRQQMGEAPPGRRTAQEMRIVQQGADIRLSARREAVADAYADILRKVNQIVFTMWSRREVIQVIGVEGAVYWVDFDPASIQREYDLKIDVESMVPQTKALRKQELMQLIQALGNNPRVNIDYLIRMFGREFEWLDMTKLLPPAPETMGGQPMGMSDFTAQQGRMLQDPAQLQKRVQGTQSALAGAVPALMGR